MLDRSPMPRGIPVQIHSIGVLASTSVAPIRIELVDKPPHRALGRRDRPQSPGDRLAGRLVAMNTADYENPSRGCGITNDVGDDRPAEYRMTDDHYSNGRRTPTRRGADASLLRRSSVLRGLQSGRRRMLRE